MHLKSRSICKKAVFGALLVLAATILFAGSALATETYLSYAVTPEWLKANLDKVTVIDARHTSLYKGQQGHIPNSVNAEWTYFANMQGKAGDPNWGKVLDSANMAKKLAALGIDGKKEVIVYGDGGDWGNASWVVWILRMSGIKNAKILDGGWTAWRAAGGKTSNTTHTNKAVAAPKVTYNDAYLVDTDWMKANINDPTIRIVDVRTDKEYSGEIRPFGERRPGHIPGAYHFPMEKVMTKDFKLLPEAELQAALAPDFYDKDQTIILYDTSGVRGAFMTMAFRLAGYKNARNYNPSYHAWSADADTEIRQGPNP